jgi:hypothetical protein
VSPIIVADSTWTLGKFSYHVLLLSCCWSTFGTIATIDLADDGLLQIILTKARKAETWPAVFKGHGELDAASSQEVRYHVRMIKH